METMRIMITKMKIEEVNNNEDEYDEDEYDDRINLWKFM
jgi:hypothetical protein